MSAPTGKKIFTAMDRIDEMLSKMSPEELKKLDSVLAEELAKPWIPTPGPQANAYLSTANLLLYGGAAGGGKHLSIDSVVLSPFGWVRMGDLKVGSKVCAIDGTVTEVIGVFPQGIVDIYWVCMEDGGKVEAGLPHKWLAWETHIGRKIGNKRTFGVAAKGIYTTEEIMRAMSKMRGRNNSPRRFAIPIAEPVALNVAGQLKGPSNFVGREIDPYLLGLLIGDGSMVAKERVNVTSADDEILIFLRKAANDELTAFTRENNKSLSIRFRGEFLRTTAASLEKLGLLGKYAVDKFIPRQYLLAPTDARFALMQGLMDSDGWCEERRACYYATVSERLANDIVHLARSLGCVASITSRVPNFSYKGEKKQGQLAYTIRIKSPEPTKLFRLERKIEIAKTIEHQSEGRIIEKIEFSRRAEAVCIQVRHPSSLYITDDFIVTHNTDLICGLALTEHQRTVVFRSQSTDLNGFWERLEILCPQTSSRNSNLKRMVTLDNRMVECGHLDSPGSERAWQGRRHDLICFDEAATIDARKINFVLGWLAPPADGSSNKARAILATNPPIGAEGAYLMEWFAPWLDTFYPNPAQTGELRWAVTVGDESEITTLWVDGPEAIYLNADRSWRLATQEEIDHRPRLTQINNPQSRTFIPALLDDNPYLRDTDYRSQLQAKPEPLRSQLLHGSFLAGREDDEWQLIPSEWIREAQKRWQVPRGKIMLSMGVDVAQGGAHKSTIAPLYDGNIFDKVMSWPGSETPNGKSIADKIILFRRDKANIAIDMTGGYGGSARDHLWENHQIKIFPIVFSSAASGGDPQSGYSFANLRAKMYWQFRMALDPSKSGTAGYIDIALPPGDRILAQLSAARWRPRSGKIVIEAKEDIQARLGSSPDEADAIVEAWHVRNMKTKAVSDDTRNQRVFGEFNSRSARLGWMG